MGIDTSGVPSFARFNPKAFREFGRAWLKYIRHIADLENKTVGDLPVTPSGFTVADLKYHPGGLPRVPLAIKNNNGHEMNAMQQSMIRAYWTKHYGKT